MARAIARARRHLTYANVVSTPDALRGPRRRHRDRRQPAGEKQRRQEAAQGQRGDHAKIKKEAVTRAKIRNGAVDGAKVKAGSLGAAEFQLGGAPYTRIVEKLSTPLSVAGNFEKPEVIPLPGFTYTQEAGRTDTFAGAIDIAFGSDCTDRLVAAYLLMDAPPDPKLTPATILKAVAVGTVTEAGNPRATTRLNLGPFSALGSRFASATPQTHTFSMIFAGKCNSGSGITATRLQLDVIGMKSP